MMDKSEKTNVKIRHFAAVAFTHKQTAVLAEEYNDDFGFSKICLSMTKNGHLSQIFQRPRQLNHAISELVFKPKVFWIFVKNCILYTAMLSYSVSFVFLAA